MLLGLTGDRALELLLLLHTSMSYLQSAIGSRELAPMRVSDGGRYRRGSHRADSEDPHLRTCLAKISSDRGKGLDRYLSRRLDDRAIRHYLCYLDSSRCSVCPSLTQLNRRLHQLTLNLLPTTRAITKVSQPTTGCHRQTLCNKVR
jgi:hypothetical protein